MNRPLSLIIVAGLFILVGVQAAWQEIVQAPNGEIMLDPLLLCLFVGIGLLRCSQLWRHVAFFCIWFLIVIMSIFTPLIILIPRGGDLSISLSSAFSLKVSGRALGPLLMLSVLIWMRWVLARRDVCDLFSKS